MWVIVEAAKWEEERERFQVYVCVCVCVNPQYTARDKGK